MGKRIVLAHLNIEVEDSDKRSDDKIKELLEGVLEIGSSGGELDGMAIVVAMIETIEAEDEGWQNAGGKPE